MKPVSSKKDFVRRYMKGEFGNRAPTWESMEHMEEDFENSIALLEDISQRWHIRNRIAGAKTWYDVSGEYLPDTWEEACKLYDSRDLYISAMAPTENTILQGEVQEQVGGLYLRYTNVRLPMREALAKEQRHCSGLKSKILLQEAMDAYSYSWVEYLLDEYSDHVIEFSVYETCWGTIPNTNTIFWEVRDY